MTRFIVHYRPEPSTVPPTVGLRQRLKRDLRDKLELGGVRYGLRCIHVEEVDDGAEPPAPLELAAWEAEGGAPAVKGGVGE